jgi:hypothetical protein
MGISSMIDSEYVQSFFRGDGSKLAQQNNGHWTGS